MTPEPYCLLQVRCENESCGMGSAFRFYRDGSFKRVFEACGHPKRWPTLDQIREAIKADAEAEAERDSTWVAASGHPGGWRVVRGRCPLEELQDRRGRRILFRTLVGAKRRAMKLNGGAV